MTHNSLVDAQDVISSGLKVTTPRFSPHFLPRGIIRRRDVAMISLSVSNGLVSIRNLVKSLNDVSQQVHGGLQLLFGIVRFNGRGGDSDVDSIGADRMIARDHRHVNICLSSLFFAYPTHAWDIRRARSAWRE